jgi:hypothetical protein
MDTKHSTTDETTTVDKSGDPKTSDSTTDETTTVDKSGDPKTSDDNTPTVSSGHKSSDHGTRLDAIEDALRAVNILPALPPEDDRDDSRKS